MLDNIWTPDPALHLDEPADRGLDDALVPGRGAARDPRGRRGGRRRADPDAAPASSRPIAMPGHRRHRADLLHLQLERASCSPVNLTATRSATAPVFLVGFITSQGLFLAKLCAAATLVSLPVLIAGFAAQDKLVQACPSAPSSSHTHGHARGTPMKAAVITGVGQVEVTTVADPIAGPRDVIVSVEGCGICGTDLHILQGEFAPTLPIVPGSRVRRHRRRGRQPGDRARGRRSGGCRPVVVLRRVLLLPQRARQPVRALGRHRGDGAGGCGGVLPWPRSPTASGCPTTSAPGTPP